MTVLFGEITTADEPRFIGVGKLKLQPLGDVKFRVLEKAIDCEYQQERFIKLKNSYTDLYRASINMCEFLQGPLQGQRPWAVNDPFLAWALPGSSCGRCDLHTPGM